MPLAGSVYIQCAVSLSKYACHKYNCQRDDQRDNENRKDCGHF